MSISFELSALIFFLPTIILLFFMDRDMRALFRLYKKKKKTDYPLESTDIFNYLDSFSHFLKIYITPFIMWKIILQIHKDKAINDAAKKVRRLLIIIFSIWIIQMFILTYLWGWYSN
jgi:hypothetical protein